MRHLPDCLLRDVQMHSAMAETRFSPQPSGAQATTIPTAGHRALPVPSVASNTPPMR